MNINTEKIKEEILNDFEERKSLLSKVKVLPSLYGFSDFDTKFYITNSVAVIYALWEGFVQESCRNYLREVQKLDLTKDKIHPHLLVFGFENSFKQFNNYPNNYPPDDKIAKKEKLIADLDTFFSSSEFIILNDVHTESNLGFSALNKIMLQLNLNSVSEAIELELIEHKPDSDLLKILCSTYPIVEHGKKYPISKELAYLLNSRNAVSHGNFNSITVDDEMIARTIKVVEIAMEQVINSIFEACAEKKYLKLGF